MTGSLGTSNPTTSDNEPNEPVVKVIIDGKPVKQAPSPVIPPEIVDTIVNMGRISRESEDAQQKGSRAEAK